MAAYPYNVRVVRNVKQAIVPVKGAEITVYNTGGSGEQVAIWPDASQTSGTEVAQPVKSDVNGQASFFLAPGRIRVGIKVDAVTTQSIEDVVVDHDNIILPVMNETPTGDLEGTEFTLSQSVLGERIALYVGGMRWEKVAVSTTPVGQQFNINVTTLTLGQAPGSGTTLIADYIPTTA